MSSNIYDLWKREVVLGGKRFRMCHRRLIEIKHLNPYDRAICVEISRNLTIFPYVNRRYDLRVRVQKQFGFLMAPSFLGLSMVRPSDNSENHGPWVPSCQRRVGYCDNCRPRQGTGVVGANGNRDECNNRDTAF
jgi:hypothetical protein